MLCWDIREGGMSVLVNSLITGGAISDVNAIIRGTPHSCVQQYANGMRY